MTIELNDNEVKFLAMIFSSMKFSIGKSKEMMLAESIMKKLPTPISKKKEDSDANPG